MGQFFCVHVIEYICLKNNTLAFSWWHTLAYPTTAQYQHDSGITIVASTFSPSLMATPKNDRKNCGYCHLALREYISKLSSYVNEIPASFLRQLLTMKSVLTHMSVRSLSSILEYPQAFPWSFSSIWQPFRFSSYMDKFTTSKSEEDLILGNGLTDQQ